MKKSNREALRKAIGIAVDAVQEINKLLEESGHSESTDDAIKEGLEQSYQRIAVMLNHATAKILHDELGG